MYFAQHHDLPKWYIALTSNNKKSNRASQNLKFTTDLVYIIVLYITYMGGVVWGGPKCPESLSYQKKTGCVWSLQFFIWYDTDFLDFFLGKKWKIDNFFFSFLLKKVGVIPKEGWARPCVPISSFGMTTTQAIRDLFAWFHPYYDVPGLSLVISLC